MLIITVSVFSVLQVLYITATVLYLALQTLCTNSRNWYNFYSDLG